MSNTTEEVNIKPLFSNENIISTDYLSSPICRACLADKNLQSLFQEQKELSDNKNLVLKMFISCTALEVSQTDEYPKFICDICLRELYKAYEFWTKCRNSLEELDRLKQIVYVKEEDKSLEDEQDVKSEYSGNDDVDTELTKTKKSLVKSRFKKKTKKKTVNPVEFLEATLDDTEPKLNTTRLNESQNASHICNICNKKYKTLSYLNLHMKKHTQEKPSETPIHLCQKCGSVLSSSRTLLEHLESHSNDRKYICKTCGKGYKTRKTLHAHTLIHAEDKKHTCEHCGQKFRVNHSLRCHIKRCHSNIRPYVCSICSKAFKFSYKLTVHVRQHTGEKPYSCKECSSAFVCGSRLKMHMLKHTGIRNYSCNVCGKKFLQPQHLKTHMITHTGECKHKCNVCGKAFKYSQILKSHMKVHKGDLEGKDETENQSNCE